MNMSILFRNINGVIGGLEFIALKCIGFIPSHILRKIGYRMFGMKIGRKSYIYAGAEIRSPKSIQIGDNVIIGHGVILDGRNGLEIANNVNLSSGVWIWTMQHDPQSPTFESVGGSVKIEDYAWISGRAIVLPGLTIGKGCVVATGAVVTKSTKPFSIVAGIPAKVIGERNTQLVYNLGDFGVTPFI